MTHSQIGQSLTDAHSCPLQRTFELLAGDWTGQIIWTLGRRGRLRHNELRRQLGDISSKVLTERLKMLVSKGLVMRNSTPSVPPNVSYELSLRGGKLDDALLELSQKIDGWDDGEQAMRIR